MVWPCQVTRFVSIGNACVWPGVWRLKLSQPQTLLPPIPPPCTVSSGEAPVWFFAQRSSGLSPALPSFTHRSEESFQKSRIWPYRLLLTSTLTPAKWAFALPAPVPSQPLLLCPPDLTPRRRLLQGPPSGSRSVLSCRLQCGVYQLTPCLGSACVNSLKLRLILTSLPWDVHRVDSRTLVAGGEEAERTSPWSRGGKT